MSDNDPFTGPDPFGGNQDGCIWVYGLVSIVLIVGVAVMAFALSWFR